MNSKVHVKKDDVVQVISGTEKGKKGKVLSAQPDKGTIIVEGVNRRTKHVKPKNRYQQGGIIHQETPIYACKVMLVCENCGRPTRIQREILEDGSKVRKCAKCKQQIKD